MVQVAIVRFFALKLLLFRFRYAVRLYYLGRRGRPLPITRVLRGHGRIDARTACYGATVK